MKGTESKNTQSGRFFFLRSESASSTVVGAVLLLGIIVTIFAVVRLGYIPEWKNDAEYSHMNDVWEDMANLKSKIDMMTIVLASDPDVLNFNSSNPNSSAEITMSVPFHMGGGDLPLIGPIKSSGTLSVNKDKCIMTVTPKPDVGGFKTISCGTVTYGSQNRYYVDQTFAYEGGALILAQKEHSSMMLYPSIRFTRVSSMNYNVSINAVEIYKEEYSPADIISSNTECSLRLTGCGFEPLYDSNRDSQGNIDSFALTVYTTHPDAWSLYLNETAQEAGLDYGTDYTLIQSESNSVRLEFPAESSSKSLKKLYVSKTVVKAEPGIGL